LPARALPAISLANDAAAADAVYLADGSQDAAKLLEVVHRQCTTPSAYLTIVFAALAVSRWIEGTDRPINQEVRQNRQPPAATARSRSRPDSTPSPPPSPSPTTFARLPTPSTTPADLRTKLRQLRPNRSRSVTALPKQEHSIGSIWRAPSSDPEHGG
jgi:hypothetical protein